MDFVTSHFGKMNLWPVAEYNSNHAQKWGQICCKSVQLVRGSSFPNDLLQNPYFRGAFIINHFLQNPHFKYICEITKFYT